MKECEFYIYEDELWYVTPEGRNERLMESDTEMIKALLDKVREQYPEAYQALANEYAKSAEYMPHYQYLMARRFCRCNFGELDATERDIRFCGSFHFEKVKCPLRGECKYDGVICNPVFNSRLSESELRVMKLLYEGLNQQEVADMLYLSPLTVKRHQMSAYAKTGTHRLSDFVIYANKNQLFKSNGTSKE